MVKLWRFLRICSVVELSLMYTLASVLVNCGNLGDLVNGKLIHGLVVKSGLESVVASQTSLLTMYSKCSMVEDSRKVFNQLAYASHMT